MQVIGKMFLLNIVLALSAPLLAAEPVKVESPVISSQAVSAGTVTSTQYVRNVTAPNGFGESMMIGESAYYTVNGDVHADDGDELEYVLLVMGDAPRLQGLVLTQHLPPFTEYVANSTRVNQQAVADVNATSAAFGALKINGQPVDKSAMATAVVSFRVKVKLLEEK